MKWEDEKGNTSKLFPLLKAIHKNNFNKKILIKAHPDYITESEVTDKGKEFYERCLKLFPFLEKELNER